MFLLTNSNFLKTIVMFLNYLSNVNFIVYKQFKNIFDIVVLLFFKKHEFFFPLKKKKTEQTTE